MVVRDPMRTGDPLLLDVATVEGYLWRGGRAHVLTQGQTGAARDESEEEFPLEVFEKGYLVNTFNSNASVEIDLRRILNAICDVGEDRLDLDIPQENHPAFA